MLNRVQHDGLRTGSGYLSLAAGPPALRAMRAYVAELEQRGGPPLADEEAIARWLDGTAVDLTSE